LDRQDEGIKGEDPGRHGRVAAGDDVESHWPQYKKTSGLAEVAHHYP